MAEVQQEDHGATLCEDEDDQIIDLDSESDDWELGDDSEEECQVLYDSPLDQVNEVLYLGAYLLQLQQNDE